MKSIKNRIYMNTNNKMRSILIIKLFMLSLCTFGQIKGIVREKVFRQQHRSGILVPLCGGVSAPTVFIPLQADLLDQKRGQIFFSFSFLSSHV